MAARGPTGFMGAPGATASYFRRELERNSSTFTPPHLKIANSLGNVGGSVFRQGRKSEAADYFVQALDMYRELDVKGRGLMQAVGNAAFLLDDAERYTEAEPLHQEYIDLAGELEGPQNSGQTNARARYFENLANQDKWDQAEQQAHAIIAWRTEQLPPEDYQRESSRLFLARAQVGQGRLTEAEENLTRVEEALNGRDDVPEKVTDRMRELRVVLGADR